MMMSSLLINKRHTGMGKYVDINVGMYEKYGLHFVRDPNKLRVLFVRTRKSYGFHSDKIRRIYGFSKYVTRNAMGSGSYGLRVNSGRVQNGSGSDTGCGALSMRVMLSKMKLYILGICWVKNYVLMKILGKPERFGK